MKTPILITVAAVAAFCGFCNVIAQTALDPTQGGAYPAYPQYLGVSCGGVQLSVLDERTNADGTVDASVSARTRCSGSGRGAPVRQYLQCWNVKFASDRYAILSRTVTQYNSWVQGRVTAPVCPEL